MAAAESTEPDPWEELLRKLLPEGAPLPDEDQLDYSISVDYVGPPPFFRPPVKHLIPKTRFSAFPKEPPSLSPVNPSWMKSCESFPKTRFSAFPRSRSSTDSTNSENKRNSASSIAFEFETEDISNEGEGEAVADHVDREEYHPCGNEGEKEMKRAVCLPCAWRKRNGCVRCGRKRGLLGLREVCVVCGAEYCSKCVVKGMGSMPEGRKCVGCIGRPINEAYRGRLGHGSRVLARLWSPPQVEQIMRAERDCKANRVRPEQVVVNGRELNEEKLEELLDCAVPVQDLRPGRYWYDKDSGLWGKEGAKPDRMITPKLGVGGKLQADASCGNTKIYMNGREITKFELRVLKLAKVECPRGTHFWLYEDGSYEEEGQNNIKGHIWEKASTRLLSSLFSLPVPPVTAKEQTTSISSVMFHEHLEKHRIQKLLLLGTDDSGTSTIFNQVKLTYANKFTTEELQRIKLIIQSNTFRYLCTLLEGLDWFEEEALLKKESTCLAPDMSVPGETECDGSEKCIYSHNQKISNFCAWFLDLFATGDIETFFPAAAREYAPIISEIWKDPAIQKIYHTMDGLQLIPDVAKYFLDRVIEISSNDYEPSEKDILLAEGVNPHNGLACVDFSLEGCSAVSEMYNQLDMPRYQLIRLSSNGPPNGFKSLDMFDDMSAVVLCISLSDYDKLWTHTTGFAQNKMLASRDYFVNVAQNSCFNNTPFLLLLTKYDIFEAKVKQAPLSVCEWFSDFNPLKSHSKEGSISDFNTLKSHSKGRSSSLPQQAFHYTALKFKELYSSITGRKLYVYPVDGRERGSVSEAFRYLREIVSWEAEVSKDGGIYAASEEQADSVSVGQKSFNYTL